MTPQDFLDQVITPALTALGLDSVPARQLLLGTALQESGLRDINQIGGPAQGVFQIEPATRADIQNWALHRHPDWCDAASRLEGEQHDAALCRLIYERAPGAIGSTPEEQAAYYKQWYNTPLGAATVGEYLRNWQAAEGVDFERPFEPAPEAPVFAGVNGAQEQVLQPADLGSLTEPVTQVVDQGGLPVQETDLGPAPQPGVLQPVASPELSALYAQGLASNGSLESMEGPGTAQPQDQPAPASDAPAAEI